MHVTWVFASISAFLALLLALLFYLATRVPRCPRCDSREWIPLPHRGRYAAYCRKCTLEVDMTTWKEVS